MHPESIFGLDVAAEDASVVLIPVPWEATTSYGRGTCAGPEAVRQASVQVDMFDAGLATAGYEARAERMGIAMLAVDPEVERRAREAAAAGLKLIEAFDASGQVPAGELLAQVNEASDWLNHWVERTVNAWRAKGKLCGVVGGDHSVALGSIRAHARDVPRLGVLQFDAHADLRVAYQGFIDSHASVMHNVLEQLPGVERLVSVGVRDLCDEEFARAEASGGRIVPFYDAQLRRHLHAGRPFEQIAETIVDALPEHVYISFDIDGLAPDLCPHTGTPVPGGLRIHQVETVLEALLRRGRRVVGFDLCEVAPGPHGEWDANVGARVLLKLIGHAVASHQGPLPQSGTPKTG